MNKFTLGVIMGLLEMDAIREDDMGIANMLYGLFDGYDYSDALMERAKVKLDTRSSEFKILKAVCEEVKTYPDGETQLF